MGQCSSELSPQTTLLETTVAVGRTLLCVGAALQSGRVRRWRCPTTPTSCRGSAAARSTRRAAFAVTAATSCADPACVCAPRTHAGPASTSRATVCTSRFPRSQRLRAVRIQPPSVHRGRTLVRRRRHVPRSVVVGFHGPSHWWSVVVVCIVKRCPRLVQFSNSITSIRCGFVVQLVSTVGNILTDIARRAVRLR